MDIKNKSAVNILKIKLSDIFDDNLGKVENIFEKYKYIISGSFITQCYLNVVWESSDIDIYTMPDVIWDNASYPGSHFEEFLSTTYNKYSISISPYNHSLKNGDDICSVRTYNMNGYDLEAITVKNHSDLGKYIVENFDFDICKNYAYYKDNDWHIHIEYPKELDSKITQFKYQRHVLSSYNRAKKYTDRGFKFMVNNNVLNDQSFISLLKEKHDIFKIIDTCDNKTSGLFVYQTDKIDISTFLKTSNSTCPCISSLKKCYKNDMKDFIENHLKPTQLETSEHIHKKLLYVWNIEEVSNYCIFKKNNIPHLHIIVGKAIFGDSYNSQTIIIAA
jgi:hypothetical protein